MSTRNSRGSGGTTYTSPAFSHPANDKDVTRERLAADMDAFDKAGGQIEVLGVTPLRRKPPKPEASTKAGDSAPAAKSG